MNKMIKLIIQLGIFCIGIMPLVAQNAYEALEKISVNYNSKKTMSFLANYQVYSDVEQNILTDSLTMNITCSGNDYYINVEEAQMLYHNGQGLLINHEQKMMLLQKELTQSPWDIKQFQALAEENELKLSAFEPTQEGIKGLRFAAPEYSDTTIELLYDAQSYLLIEVLVDVKLLDSYSKTAFNNTRTRVTYSNYDISDRVFPYQISQFITSNNKPVAKYRNYQLIQS